MECVLGEGGLRVLFADVVYATRWETQREMYVSRIWGWCLVFWCFGGCVLWMCAICVMCGCVCYLCAICDVCAMWWVLCDGKCDVL